MERAGEKGGKLFMDKLLILILQICNNAQTTKCLGVLFCADRFDELQSDPGREACAKAKQEPQLAVPRGVEGMAGQDRAQSPSQSPRKNRTGKNGAMGF
jgi:hypothetical protein